jgi:hypothetical protein
MLAKRWGVGTEAGAMIRSVEEASFIVMVLLEIFAGVDVDTDGGRLFRGDKVEADIDFLTLGPTEDCSRDK